MAGPLASVLFGLALLIPSWAMAQDGPQSLPTLPLVVETAAGARHDFTVEVADDPEERRIGLMNRPELADDHGMLFLFEHPQNLSFWMRNTLIPLDLLFIQSDGRIANIARGEPLSLAPIPSKGRALAVLELKGGRAAALGIAPGDFVRLDALVTQATP
ncbi:MAG: DUF192 domain-containing protein [Pseudomonadota bacterium]